MRSMRKWRIQKIPLLFHTGLTAALVKENGIIREEVYKADGLYGNHYQRNCKTLGKGKRVCRKLHAGEMYRFADKVLRHRFTRDMG